MNKHQIQPTTRAVALAVVSTSALICAVCAPVTHAAGAMGPASGGGRHGLGALLPAGPRITPRRTAGAAADTSLPATADISQYNPPVADQGGDQSCVAWVADYYMRGWYARRDGYYPGGGSDGAGSFAPMYTYSQVTNGQNVPTTFNANLDIQVSQGVDTRADYAQGDYDYTDQPTTVEHGSAALYKISGYTVLFQGAQQGLPAQQAIETAIAGGAPVGLIIPVYSSFEQASPTNDYVDVPPAGTQPDGYHAVFATRYDDQGLWIENQWGTGWGNNGWAELSWAFIEQYAMQALTMQPITPPLSQITPVLPTETPVPATVTPVPPTSTPVPTVALPPFAPAPPTATPPVPEAATATPEAPTSTPLPPSATPVPPTATSVPPSATALPPTMTPTPPPPTATPTMPPAPDTATPVWLPATATAGSIPSQGTGTATSTGSQTVGRAWAGRPSPTATSFLAPVVGQPRATSTPAHRPRHTGPAAPTTHRTQKGAVRPRPAAGTANRAHQHVQRHFLKGVTMRPRRQRAGGTLGSTTYRDVILPAHARRIMLQLAYRPLVAVTHGQHAPGTDAGWLAVSVTSPGTGKTLAQVLRAPLMVSSTAPALSAGAPAQGQSIGWHRVGYDLTRFRGRHIRLALRTYPARAGVSVVVDLSYISVMAQ